MRDGEGLPARLFDVAVVVSGAAAASRITLGHIAEAGSCLPFAAFAAVFSLLLFPGFGVYASRHGRGRFLLASRVTLAWLAVQACVLVLMFLLYRLDDVSRLWITHWTMISGAALIAGRLFRMRGPGMNVHRVAIVGCGRHCEAVMMRIERASHSGIRAIALFNAVPDSPIASHVPVFDDVDAFVNEVREQYANEVWLALPMSQDHVILRFVNAFRDDLVNVRFIPDMRNLALFESGVSEVLGVPAIDLVASPFSHGALLRKDIFDRVFALFALIAIAPLLVGIAIVLKLGSRGPVLFKQRRKGADGRVFTLYKFRSMHLDQPTRVGALLRRTGLDELPQFFNVLRGDMSLVGPRPHAPEHDELYQQAASGHVHHYRIKPGITGWAQVNGLREEADRIEKMEARVAHDLYYLANWSFGLDMRIIAVTFLNGLRSANNC
ncbi:sugar transferase [Caballeronia temeraria]|uniref:Sugar transferase n=1 Tax=Caballeronia temeraria TaxID=1777137 RepID=A0A157ZVI8_9BURK|nr:exopolysaccharide biosynthesis polyprenyl glycosylphosphotransferase [Caballeronia temeraria]SAK49503.1 sugar transferase [Caballeronia temeraria]